VIKVFATQESLERQEMWRVVEKIPGPKQLEALFLIFLTLGSIKQNNTDPHLETERI